MNMVIIAIGHESDTYSCSCEASRDDIDPMRMSTVLSYVIQNQNLRKDSIDELIVIANDKVVVHYTHDNGLGSSEDEYE